MKKSRTEGVIIIGGGPAGMSCAIQLKRCGIASLIFDSNNNGGLLRYANLVENYPGFPGGIKGLDLAKRFREQFRLEKLICLKQKVLNIKYKRGLFEVTTKNNYYTSEYLVIASGTKSKRINDFYIEPSLSNSIFYGTSGLSKKKNKHFVIIGAGDLAFDYCLSLGKMNEVTILNRSDMPKCIPLLYQRAEKLNNFTYYNNTVLNQVERLGKDKLSIIIKSSYGYTILIANYLIFAIGQEANIDFVDVEFKKEFNLLSKLGKLYTIGDAANKQYRQTAIATGDGIKAAMQIYEKKRGFK